MIEEGGMRCLLKKVLNTLWPWRRLILHLPYTRGPGEEGQLQHQSENLILSPANQENITLPPANQENLTLPPANQENLTLPPANQETAPLATSTPLLMLFPLLEMPFPFTAWPNSVAFSGSGSAMPSFGKLCVTLGRKKEHWPSWTPKAEPRPLSPDYEAGRESQTLG